MSQLRVLLYKEWRDQRTLIVGAVAVCLVAVVIAKLLHGAHFDPLARTRFVLPGCLGLFTLVLATESITRDAQNGVERSLLRLPVPRATAWLAKLSFVAGAGFAFLVLLVLVELLLRTLEHRSALDGLYAMIQPTWWLLIAAIGSACLASACVLKRSLPAAFLGIAAIAGIPLLGFLLPEGHARELLDVMLNSWKPAELAAIGCAAFLLGSILAFHVRRPDALGLRRAAVGVLGAGAILVPLAAGTAYTQSWAMDIVPLSKTAEITWITPSPDGRFLALQLMQSWRARENWIALAEGRGQTDQRTRGEVWIIDCSTGAWNEIDERCRSVFGVETNWSADGTLRTVSSNGCFGSGDVRVERIDPFTGRVVSSHPDSESEDLGLWYERRSHGSETILRWKANGRELRLPVDAMLRPSTQPGIVFHELNGDLVRHDLEHDTTTRLAALRAPNSWVRVSPDGQYLHLFDGKTTCILDASTGAVVRECRQAPYFVGWSRLPGRVALLSSGRGDWTALMTDGSLEHLPLHALRCLELGQDRLLAFDEHSIECVKLDGSERKVLYQARP